MKSGQNWLKLSETIGHSIGAISTNFGQKWPTFHSQDFHTKFDRLILRPQFKDQRSYNVLEDLRLPLRSLMVARGHERSCHVLKELKAA